MTPTVYSLKPKGKVASLTDWTLQSRRQNHGCSNNHIDYVRLDAIFDDAFNSNKHNVWIRLIILSNQA
jgi:hypothetical protein